MKIIAEAIPIILMILLIPNIINDYILTLLYLLIIAACFFIKYERKDALFLIFGFVIMIVSESFFILMGVETFNRNTLFGIMPIWLPILWAYAFVVIKRSINIL